MYSTFANVMLLKITNFDCHFVEFKTLVELCFPTFFNGRIINVFLNIFFVDHSNVALNILRTKKDFVGLT